MPALPLPAKQPAASPAPPRTDRHAAVRGLRRRLLIMALLPAALLTLAVSAYLVIAETRLQESRFRAQGQGLAQEAARLMAPALGEPQRMHAVAERFLDRTAATALSVRDATDANLLDRRLPGEAPARIESIRFRSFPALIPPPADTQAAPGHPRSAQVVITLAHIPVSPEQRRLHRNAILLLLCGLIVTALLTRWLSNGLARPLGRLSEAAADFRAGDHRVRVPETSKGALGSLEKSFNAMAAAVEAAHAEKEQEANRAARELTQTLNELEERNVQLDLTRKRAEAATRVKSEFLAKMSHEIRTPMNSMVGFTEQLRNTRLATHQRDLLRLIEHSGADLLRIIDDILDYSDLEYGAFQPQSATFDVRETFEHAAALFGPQAHERKLELLLLAYEDVPQRLMGDQTRIRQILANLLGNAIKFTERGEITIRVMAGPESPEALELIFSVTDTGIGISPQVRQRLFNAFEQADPSLTRRFGGIGLGLSITFKLIRAMNGRIAIHSDQGQGSAFTVHLPLARDPEAAPSHAEPQPFAARPCRLHCRHRLSQLELNHRLEGLGFEVEAYDPNAPEPEAAAALVLGFDAEEAALQAPERFLQELKPALHATTLVLISDSDRGRHSAIERRFGCRCHAKPLLTETLQRELQELLADPRQTPPPLEDAAPPGPDPALRGARVLVVEDNAFNRDLLLRQLNHLGCKADAVDSGQAALATTLDQAYQVILMDIHMPGLSGVETTVRLREREQRLGGPRPIIIALTADVMSDTRAEAAAAGVDGLLFKPVSEGQLRRLLKDALANQGAPGLWRLPAEAPQAAAATPAEPPVIDRQKALTVSGGSVELADELIRRLARELPAYQQEIRRLAAATDAQALKGAVHKLRGALTLCGAMALEGIARQLELRLANGAPIKDCTDLTAQTLSEIQRLIDTVSGPDG